MKMKQFHNHLIYIHDGILIPGNASSSLYTELVPCLSAHLVNMKSDDMCRHGFWSILIQGNGITWSNMVWLSNSPLETKCIEILYHINECPEGIYIFQNCHQQKLWTICLGLKVFESIIVPFRGCPFSVPCTDVKSAIVIAQILPITTIINASPDQGRRVVDLFFWLCTNIKWIHLMHEIISRFPL